MTTSTNRRRHDTIASADVGRRLWNAVPATVDLVFDGNCGFCTRTIRLLRRVDRHDRVRIIAAQLPDTEAQTGVSPQDSLLATWAVTPTGRRVAGAPAIALALSVATGIRAPLHPWKIPGAHRLLDRTYRWIADNRYRFRGDTPWCDQHSCTSEQRFQGVARTRDDVRPARRCDGGGCAGSGSSGLAARTSASPTSRSRP